eukprot:TRINITY_DN67579_c2_g4_i2.p3 TRINITY_DN67579_c2_g4~~TRINITY_DN67579_c2_g4_i2.p3  ORF type:complete len:169 (-),score=97.23 TRINITY_DN67579_c2_g4_i2:86-592(-)
MGSRHAGDDDGNDDSRTTAAGSSKNNDAASTKKSKSLQHETKKVCIDKKLVSAVTSLMHAISLDTFDPSLDPSLGSKEKKFLTRCAAMCSFFKDTYELLDLFECTLLSNRRMEQIVMRFLHAKDSAERQASFAAVNEQSTMARTDMLRAIGRQQKRKRHKKKQLPLFD